MFPIEESGPNKGKILPRRDERGNIIVDPTTLVQKDPLLIDYKLYSRLKDNAEKGKQLDLDPYISKKERLEMKHVFRPHHSFDQSGPSRMQQFRTKSEITRKMIK